MNKFFRLLFMPCEGITGFISDSLDRDLTFTERIAIRVHLVYCAACRKFRKNARRVRELLEAAASGAEASGEPELSPQARARITEAINRRSAAS